MDAAERSSLQGLHAASGLLWLEQAQEIGELPRDPVNGQLDPDLLQKMASERSHLSPGAKTQLEQSIKLARARPDISTFDFQSLVVQSGARWTLELLYAGKVDTDGDVITVDYGTSSMTSGASDRYSYRCFENNARSMMTVARYRQASLEPDELTVAKLIDFLRTMIVHPIPPSSPSLPECLLLPNEIAGLLSRPSLRNFLDSLPAPFTWRMESSHERRTRIFASEARKKHELGLILRYMNDLKEQGNDVFRKNDRDKAIKRYSEAIVVKSTEDILMGNLSVREEARKKLLAICYGNRAAAYLLPGEGLDPVRAIKDAEEAEKLDPNYKKAYLRQARGYALLGEKNKGINILNRAVQRKEFITDIVLTKELILMQTDGKDILYKKDGRDVLLVVTGQNKGVYEIAV